MERPEVDVVYGNVRYFTKNPVDSSGWMYSFWGAKKEWMPKISGQGNEFLVQALKGSFAHINSFLFRKSIVDKAGPWDEKKRAAEDYLFVLDCVLAGGHFVYADLPDTLDLVRWHDNNASHKVKWIREQEKQMRIELMPRIEATGYTSAIEMNVMAIKALGSYDQGVAGKRNYFQVALLIFLKKTSAIPQEWIKSFRQFFYK